MQLRAEAAGRVLASGVTAEPPTRSAASLRWRAWAETAGVSIDYYTRLERGNLAGASESVLDAMTGAPAWIRNGRADILAANALGRAL